ncbi:MAG TPA: hypothetical protein VK550_12370 [Polyangiaceae bacterium]|nr:hypothetical protein [Polyangiaceae bacterium]
MLDPSPSFVRFARPARLLLMWITCIALASVMIWPSIALADDPNQAVTTGIPIVDATLKVLGAIYVLLSTILLILPKTSKLALGLASFVADLKGIVAQNAAVKEATTGAMAAKIKRESTVPPPRGFADASILVGLSVLTLVLAELAFGLFATGCKTNAARTACDIVHIVDDGCQAFVEVPLPDGTTEKVPRSEIVRLAKASKAARLSGAP